MNKTFKVIFSKARNALMVVNEATGSVQAKGTKTVVATAVTAALMVGGMAVAAERVVVDIDGNETIESETNFSELTDSEFGGAIYNDGGNFTVKDSVSFDKNQASIGGAVSNRGQHGVGTAQIGDNVTFTNNIATMQGGAIHNQTASLTIGKNATFKGNQSKIEGSAGGGAIYIDTDGTQDSVVTLGEDAVFEENTAASSGGAIYLYAQNENASANVNVGANSSFIGNTAGKNGGAVFAYAAEATFGEKTSFIGNSAKEMGGAIYNTGSLVVGNNSTFDGNKAQIGGAISNNGTSGEAVATIGDNVTFSNNTSENQGGAIHNQKADLTIGDDAKFIKNSTLNEGHSGGALYIDTDGSKASNVTLGDRTLFEGNSTKHSGGALYAYSADSYGGNEQVTVTLGSDSQFKNNSANRGGAVASFASNTSIGANAIFTGNTAESDGGAIYSSGYGSTAATLNLGDNATFMHNQAKGNGGAVFNGKDSTLTIKSATFADNWAGDKLNDIHNDGDLEVNGDLSLDGGITGEGTTHFLAESSLNVKVGMNQGQCTTITNTVVVDEGAELSFTFAPGYVGEYQLFTDDVQGEFDVNFNNSVFDITVNKDGEFVVAQKSAEGIAQATGANINQAAAIRAIMGDFSGSNETFDAIAESVALGIQSANASDRQAALDAVTALSTDAAPVIAQTQTDTATQVYAAVGSRFELTNTQEPGSNLWVQGLFSTGDYDDNGTAKGYDTDSNGIAFGLDSAVTDSVKVGVGFAYTDTDIDGFLRDTDVESKTAFIYGQYKPSNWYVNGIMSYGWSSYDESKHVAGFNVGADYDVETFGLQAMTGYDFEVAGVNITPEAGLRYFRISQDGYTDGAGSTVGSEDNDVLTAVIGAKVDKAWEVSPSVVIKPQARLAMTYDLVDADNNAVITLANGATYSVNGETMDRFGVEVDVGVAAEVTDNFEFALTYSGNFRGDFQNHAGLINAKYKF